MFNVMRAALSAHNVGISIDPATYDTLPAFTPADLLAMATIEGARASGLAHRTGSITPGKDADLIVIRLDDANLLPANDIAASIVGAGHPGNIDTVLVAGRVRKYQGRLVDVDLGDIRRRAERPETGCSASTSSTAERPHTPPQRIHIQKGPP